LLKRLLHLTVLVTGLGLIFSIPPSIDAQSTDEPSEWSLVRECLPQAQPRPEDYTFPGFIASYVPDDGIRALRSETFTTYYLAFAGSNFVEAADFSPDGRWLAIPYGFIETAGAFDVRYLVQELRIMTTGTFPQISARVPWQASFQQGDLTAAAWLDKETFSFPQGSFLNGQTVQQVQPFTGEIRPFGAGTYEHRSPDGARGFQTETGRLALYDLTNPFLSPLAYFPVQQVNLSGMVWSPDSSQLLALEADAGAERWLSLYSRDGVLLARIFDLTVEHLLASVNWSSDGTQFAFTAYDPYDNENALYIGEVANQTVRETCLLLETRYTHTPEEALAWSPDGASLALALPAGLHIYESTANALYRIGDDIGGLMGWMIGE
jgi:WD40 repeat protein